MLRNAGLGMLSTANEFHWNVSSFGSAKKRGRFRIHTDGRAKTDESESDITTFYSPVVQESETNLG